MKRVFIIFFLCYTHYGFLRFISNDLQYVTKGEWKNEKNTLPIRKGTKVALFGKGTVDYVKGGGGSGDVTVEYIRNPVSYTHLDVYKRQVYM